MHTIKQSIFLEYAVSRKELAFVSSKKKYTCFHTVKKILAVGKKIKKLAPREKPSPRSPPPTPPRPENRMVGSL